MVPELPGPTVTFQKSAMEASLNSSSWKKYGLVVVVELEVEVLDDVEAVLVEVLVVVLVLVDVDVVDIDYIPQ